MRCEFHHPVVRDLAWVIGSPSLLAAGEDRVSDSWCRVAWFDRIPWLRELDHHPAPLEAFLARHRSHLLGYYFETLIAFWLAHWPRIDLIASRLQVEREGRPIGDFDFIFHDRFAHRTFHWEVAVKFFLRHQEGDGRFSWLGPNPRDTLERKLGKVFSHQLTLSHTAEGAALLQRYHVEAPEPRTFIKGWLFTPATQEGVEPLPVDCSPEHLRGWWCYLQEHEAIPQHAPQSRWQPLERLRWLSPLRSDGEEGLLTREAMQAMLAAHFNHSDKPLLLAEVVADVHGVWREVSRGFIVPDHWPGER